MRRWTRRRAPDCSGHSPRTLSVAPIRTEHRVARRAQLCDVNLACFQSSCEKLVARRGPAVEVPTIGPRRARHTGKRTITGRAPRLHQKPRRELARHEPFLLEPLTHVGTDLVTACANGRTGCSNEIGRPRRPADLPPGPQRALCTPGLPFSASTSSPLSSASAQVPRRSA